jgi:methyl-accepting chemotaxis protein
MQTLKPSLQVGIHLISGSRRAAANARRPGLLAKETARATEDIAQKIDAIQSESEAAVKAIAEVSKIITQVNDISDTIASAVDKQTATTAEIGRNVTAAAVGTNEITASIARVAGSAQLTTAGAIDTQTAARSLNEMAAHLQRLANRIKRG